MTRPTAIGGDRTGATQRARLGRSDRPRIDSAGSPEALRATQVDPRISKIEPEATQVDPSWSIWGEKVDFGAILGGFFIDFGTEIGSETA